MNAGRPLVRTTDSAVGTRSAISGLAVGWGQKTQIRALFHLFQYIIRPRWRMGRQIIDATVIAARRPRLSMEKLNLLKVRGLVAQFPARPAPR